MLCRFESPATLPFISHSLIGGVFTSAPHLEHSTNVSDLLFYFLVRSFLGKHLFSERIVSHVSHGYLEQVLHTLESTCCFMYTTLRHWLHEGQIGTVVRRKGHSMIIPVGREGFPSCPEREIASSSISMMMCEGFFLGCFCCCESTYLLIFRVGLKEIGFVTPHTPDSLNL